jgi:hypothetical protein
MLRWHRLFFVMLMSILVVRVFAQDVVIQDIVGYVNQARNTTGVPSLILSSELVAAAQAHSDDMAATNTLSHAGSDGSQFWERMQRAGYTLTTGAENVLFRYDTNAEATFKQWQESAAHNENMMNPAYIEIGVAYAPATDGKLYFTMVLGARQGVTAPPLTDPLPTRTPQPATATPTSTSEAVLPATNTAVGLIFPTATLNLPSPTATDTALPPTALPAASPTSADARQAIVAQAARDSLQYFSVALASQAGIPLPPPTIAAFPTDAPTPFLGPDLLLVYDDDTFTLINVSGKRQYVRLLYFESATGSFSAERWINPYLSRALEAFTPDDCLQIWRTSTSTIPQKPPTCQTRHSYAIVSPPGQFWRNTDKFIVVNNLEETRTVAVCEVAAGVCPVNLFAEVTPPSLDVPTATPRASADVRLLISPDAVTLINTSGRQLNLSDLVFESGDASFAAWSWYIPELSRPLNAFTPNDCLDVWRVGISYREQSSQCNIRHVWLPVGASQQFWINTDTFRVRYGDVPVATCNVHAEVCEFNLP